MLVYLYVILVKCKKFPEGNGSFDIDPQFPEDKEYEYQDNITGQCKKGFLLPDGRQNTSFTCSAEKKWTQERSCHAGNFSR